MFCRCRNIAYLSFVQSLHALDHNTAQCFSCSYLVPRLILSAQVSITGGLPPSGMLDVECLHGGVPCSHFLVLITSDKLMAQELGELFLLKHSSHIKPPGENLRIRPVHGYSDVCLCVLSSCWGIQKGMRATMKSCGSGYTLMPFSSCIELSCYEDLF